MTTASKDIAALVEPEALEQMLWFLRDRDDKLCTDAASLIEALAKEQDDFQRQIDSYRLKEAEWSDQLAALQAKIAALEVQAASAKEWATRAFTAERRVIETEEALRKIETGKIKGEPGNYKDALLIVRDIARQALSGSGD